MLAKSGASEVTERPAAALAPALTPHGRLHLAAAEDGPALPEDVGERLREAFDRGAGHGLLQLGAGEIATPPSSSPCGTRWPPPSATSDSTRASGQDTSC